MGEWVSTNERLPECWSQHGTNFASGQVLVCTIYGEIEISQLWDSKHWEDGEGGWEDLSYVTHWMPLPPFPDK